MNEGLAEKIEYLIQPFLERCNVVLFDLNVHQYGSMARIEILLDKPNGGISIQECADLNRWIGEALENQNLIEHHYTLEVASPGLDRPIKTKKDFMRVQGQGVRFFLNEPIDNKLEFEGVIEEVSDSAILTNIGEQAISIPLGNVNRAKLKIKM